MVGLLTISAKKVNLGKQLLFFNKGGQASLSRFRFASASSFIKILAALRTEAFAPGLTQGLHRHAQDHLLPDDIAQTKAIALIIGKPQILFDQLHLFFFQTF